MIDTATPYDRSISLTAKGEATVYLLKLRRLLGEMSRPDRDDILGRIGELAQSDRSSKE